MRVFLAGGTGVIGRPLVARMLAAGHQVGVLARSESSADNVRAMGAEPVEGDALNALSLGYAVRTFRPEIIINQLTALPRSLLNPVAAARGMKLTNRLRTEAAPVLAEAGAEVGAHLMISQSISFAQEPGPGVRTEDDPLYTKAPRAHRSVIAALAATEEATLSADPLDGVVLRYGFFYGPGSFFAAGEAYPRMLDRRMLPIVGEGRGIWSLVHVDDAVDATLKAFTADPGVYNIGDDDPVAWAELAPWMAYAVGAKPPRRLPRALFGGGPLTIMRYQFDEQPAVSTEKARESLKWEPRIPSWRTELARVLRGE